MNLSESSYKNHLVETRAEMRRTFSWWAHWSGQPCRYFLYGLLMLLAGCSKGMDPSKVADSPPAIDFGQIKTRAVQGDAHSQKALADCYASGQGVTQNYAEAVQWYRKAADQGDAEAQNSLGELYEAGQGKLAQSFMEASEWYRKAARQGLASAQYNLAVLLAFGRGVKPSDPEAAQWYLKAAEQGHALAQYNIGQRYQFGRGVTKDLVEAYKWLALAAKVLPDAEESQREVKSLLSGQDLAEGRHRVAAFRPVTLGKTP